jgi:hypothetical protein
LDYLKNKSQKKRRKKEICKYATKGRITENLQIGKCGHEENEKDLKNRI